MNAKRSKTDNSKKRTLLWCLFKKLESQKSQVFSALQSYVIKILHFVFSLKLDDWTFILFAFVDIL